MKTGTSSTSRWTTTTWRAGGTRYFWGERVVKYHRTLTSYLDTLLQSGFTLRRLVEPKPPEELMDLPGMRDELRRPMMLLIAAEKR